MNYPEHSGNFEKIEKKLKQIDTQIIQIIKTNLFTTSSLMYLYDYIEEKEKIE